MRFSPVISVVMLVTATALMLLSSAAAICSCILCIQVVAEFWQEAGSSSRNSGKQVLAVLMMQHIGLIGVTVLALNVGHH